MVENKIKTTEHIDLSDRIMQEIDEKHITMRPKFYFVVGSILLGFGFISAVIAGVLFISVSSFHLRTHGPFEYLEFGELGLNAFLSTFPFIPIILSFITIGVGIYLIRKYEISYKHSFAGVVVTLIVSAASIGYILDEIGVNEHLAGVPPLQGLFQEESLGDQWIIGEISFVERDNRRFVISTPRQEKVLVVWDDETILPQGAMFDVGQRVRIVGEWEDGFFTADGIGIGGMHWRPLPTVKQPQVHGLFRNTPPPRD